MDLLPQKLREGKVYQREEQPNNVVMVKKRKIPFFNNKTGEDEIKEVEQLVNLNLISGDIMPVMLSWNDFKATDWKIVDLAKLRKSREKKK